MIDEPKEDAVTRLMRWYASQCDGEWEHEYGLGIESMDNPGWIVRIDLAYTGVEPAAIETLSKHRSEHDWIECSIKSGCAFTPDGEGLAHFVGMGGLHNLAEIIEYFLQHTYSS
ncbi:MAG: immunity 53 family protein [Phycisphaerales bacterium]|mgnify:CR=1 FL=1